MKNKIVGIIYFICLAILFRITLPAFGLEDYQISTNISETKYSKTREIETLFKNNLGEFNEFITYTTVPRGLILSVDSSNFFTPGSTEIIEDSKNFLDKIGQTIKTLDKLCVIEGNANLSKNTNTNYPTNWEISNAQAQELSKYLIKIHNISPNKIRAIGFGASVPAKIIQRIDFVILNYEGGG